MPSHARDRRRIDRSEIPAGAATEVAITRTIEHEGPIKLLAPDLEASEHQHDREQKTTLALLLGTVGIVYGDIGTSPIYAFREAFRGALGPTPMNVYGVLSLITWSLVLVVTMKYLIFIMRADNRGEGGILALLALLLPELHTRSARLRILWVVAGLFGAALLYGDGVITPAISVLSATEGLRIASATSVRFVVPLAVAILTALFAMQRHGTGRVGRLFGPVMVAWFIIIGALGLRQVMQHPAILSALSPQYAAQFFGAHGMQGIAVLGAVVLVVTGAEALYADMGHFGRAPIRIVWIALVLPSLLLNYLGQGALLLTRPEVRHPFFELAPAWGLYPLVFLATAATVIASQALISGAFSLTRQLMHLGYCPVVTVLHTSSEQEGQVYVPVVNWLLLAGCLVLVLGLRSSDRLGSAYGLAVSGTMALTTVLFARIMFRNWKWHWMIVAAVTLAFATLDLGFLAANVSKIPTGGWIPLAIALMTCFVFITWRRGRARLLASRRRSSMSIERLLDEVARESPCRTPGTAIFLTADEDVAPGALRLYLDRIRSLHEQVILVTVKASEEARVPAAQRMEVTRLPMGFVAVVACYGFMQTIALAEVLAACEAQGVCRLPESPTYFLAREQLHPTGRARMARWRKGLFIFLHRNAPTMQDFFARPRHQVLELGVPVEI